VQTLLTKLHRLILGLADVRAMHAVATDHEAIRSISIVIIYDVIYDVIFHHRALPSHGIKYIFFAESQINCYVTAPSCRFTNSKFCSVICVKRRTQIIITK